jgi:hypothetical protein
MTWNQWCLFPALAAAAACSSSSSPQGAPSSVSDSGIPVVADAGDSGSKGSGHGDAGSSTDAGDAGPTQSGVLLPFYVSDQFLPTGFMGDSKASMSAITLSHDSSMCKSPRQTGAGGDCYTVTWAPSLGDAGAAWAGVYWQSPANNWGSKPGKAIAPGATKLSFYAAGAMGGETIQVCAGGINAMGASASLPYADTFSVKQPPITLTTSWTQYELSLQGTSYTSVLGAFCWVASATSSESVTFYIDDVQWE